MLDIVRGTAAPRLIRAGDRHLFVSPPSLRGAATLVAHLAEMPSVREEYERESGHPPPDDWLPRPGSRRSIAALLSEAFPLLLYVATRRDHPGLDYERVAELAASIFSERDIHLVAALATLGRPFRGRWSRDEGEPGEDDEADDPSAPDPGDRDGIESIDLGRMLESPKIRFRLFTPEQVGDMTFDQVANVVHGGEPGAASSAGGRPMTTQEALAYVQECIRARAEGREAPPCP